MAEPSDFISTYRSALADFDNELFKGESAQARAYRRVDVLFGVLFGFVGLFFGLVYMRYAIPVVVGIAFIIYGIVLITIRTCSFWRPIPLVKPEFTKSMQQGGPVRPKPCYETFAKKRGARSIPRMSN